MENVQDLLRARVPILKMFDPVSRFHIDICINNELVAHNTDLLSAYMDLDPRVKPLCLLVKYWAKRREVNETYRGTLSSYAYVLLVINFLQTRVHPVVPCLQRMVNGREVQPGEVLPTEIISNADRPLDRPVEKPAEYNVYFDRSRPVYESRNTTSLAGLLLEFFRYYAFDFDYENHVVSVREGRVLPREEKHWDVISVQLEAEAAEREFLVEQEIAKQEALAQMAMMAQQAELARKEALEQEDQLAKAVQLVKDMSLQSQAQSSQQQQQANGGAGVFMEQDGKLVRGSDTSRLFPPLRASAKPLANISESAVEVPSAVAASVTVASERTPVSKDPVPDANLSPAQQSAKVRNDVATKSQQLKKNSQTHSA